MIDGELVGGRSQLVTRDGLDQSAFEGVYNRHWSDVFRYAWLLTQNHHDAEDVAAEVFRRAMEAWRAGHGPSGDPVPWLFTIARRISIDRHRRGRLLRWLPLERAPEPDDDREQAAYRRSETWIWFEQLCRILPVQQRDALVLRYAFDLSDGAAAAVLGTSVGNVRTLVSRGLATLRQQPEVMER